MLASQFAERAKGIVDTVFVCLDELGEIGTSMRCKGYQVEVLGRKPGMDWRLIRQMNRFFKIHNVDVIHAHQYTPFFYSSLARFSRSRPRLIFTEHGRHIPDTPSNKRVFANKFLLKTHDYVTAVGRDVKSALVKNEGIPTRRIEVIKNGVEIELFMNSSDKRKSARESLEVQEHLFVIAQIARLNPLKDHKTSVYAMAKVVKSCPNAVLLLVGDGEERENIEDLVDKMNLRSNVRLYGSRQDVATFLHAADAFMLTSKSEGIPLTLVEAMAASLPCIATRVGGVPEVIESEDSGLIVESGDPEAVAGALLRLIGNPALRQRISRAGFSRAVGSFSDTEMHLRYQRMYLEAASIRLAKTRKTVRKI